jgi:hypothetical protein
MILVSLMVYKRTRQWLMYPYDTCGDMHGMYYAIWMAYINVMTYMAYMTLQDNESRHCFLALKTPSFTNSSSPLNLGCGDRLLLLVCTSVLVSNLLSHVF